MKEFLNVTQNQYYFKILPTSKLKAHFIDSTQDAIQHWYCNVDNAAQWWFSTVWLETLVNLQKWYIQYFLVKMWVGVLITHT